MRRIVIGGIAVAVVGLGVALAAATTHHRAYGTHGAAAPASSASATRVSTSQSRIGPILVDGAGRTLYLFEADPADKSVCTGSCLNLWPPLIADGNVLATGDATFGLLGSVHRSDGTVQVSYHGHALYYFAGDRMAGDITGEGLNQFGAGWDVLSPQGAKIEGGH